MRQYGAFYKCGHYSEKGLRVSDKHTGFSWLLKDGPKEGRMACQVRETAKMKLWDMLI